MGIRNEIEALNRRMIEETQREIQVMTEVSRVVLDITEARERGYAHLAQVFAGHLPRPQVQPQPLQAAPGQPPVEGTMGAIWDDYDQAYRRPVLGNTDPHAYDRAVAEAHARNDAGYHADDGADAMAQRFSHQQYNGGHYEGGHQ